ncbi:hypothetical protein VTK73DRAFT_3510 [Phialemonium thermophilum]|uniref:Uncharacterized protein n=1 Tax=Phialemonium thermophilum TaxID=223376 RepID=A0ABR3WYJ5_9PEZI
MDERRQDEQVIPQPAKIDLMDLTDAESNAMRRHLFELHSLHQSESEFTTGTVLAVVRFPWDSGTDCNGILFKPVYQMRIDYQKLVATGAAKIQKLLEPRQQARIRRRLNLTQLPEGVEFVVDLTPPAEGPDLAELMASLWLPKGTKLWYLAGHYRPDHILATEPDYTPAVHGPEGQPRFRSRPLANQVVGSVLVLGHDDKCSCPGTEDDVTAPWKQREAPGIYEGPHVPRYREIADYCEVRHRVAILRLLRAINGADLLINSATRMWTVVQTAIDLDLTSLIRDSVAQWFMAAPNTKFIEIYPEESFRVALALQLPDVLVASFKILVNESAIDQAVTPPSPRRPAFTWIGRKRGDYGDLPQDPIEHAAAAFAERIKKRLDFLLSDEVLDTFDIPEWDSLKSFGAVLFHDLQQGHEVSKTIQDLHILYQELTGHIKTRVIEYVYEALEPSPPPSSPLRKFLDAQRLHYTPAEKLVPLDQLQKNLNHHQRAICPFFWENLRYGYLQGPDYVGSETWWKIESAGFEFNNAIKSSAGSLFPQDDPFTSMFSTKDGPFQFNLKNFKIELDRQLNLFCLEVVGTETENDSQGLPLVLSDHIIRKLDENELKFLPIWAGGYDDGSGGVFQAQIPPADMGPSEPGPAYHTGWTVGTDADEHSTAGYTETVSDLGVHHLDIYDVTPVPSVAVAGSASTTTNRSPAAFPPRSGAVVPSAASSERFVRDDGEFVSAMYKEPGERQESIGEALVSYVEGVDEPEATETASSTANWEEVMDEDEHDDDDIMSDDTLSAVDVGDGSSRTLSVAGTDTTSEFEFV